MRSKRRRWAWIAGLTGLAVLALACGAEPAPEIVDGPVGGLVQVDDTKAEVRGYAQEAADAAGAELKVLDEEETTCGGESVDYVLDVYSIQARYGIEVAAADRAAAVEKIRAFWKSKGYKLRKETAPNDVEADAGEASLGLQPADKTATLPLYVNSACHTNPDTPSPRPSS